MEDGGSGSYALTGAVATFQRTWKATAVSGSYALTGTPVNLLTVGARAIIGLPGSYALAGAALPPGIPAARFWLSAVPMR